LREAVELRKKGVVALKDHRTGDFQVKISHKPSCESSDWCEELGGAIKRLKPIKTLEMNAGGEYVEDLLASIEEGPALLALHLPKAELTDRGLERIRRFVSLEVLNVSQTRISDQGLVHLAGLAKLSHLSLGGTGITAIGLEYLRALPMLQSLDINGTRVDDAAFITLAQLPALRHLALRGTRVTFAAVKAFSGRRADVVLDWVPTLKLIGYWADDDHAAKCAYARARSRTVEAAAEPVASRDTDEDSPFIHPRRLVDSAWAREDRSRVVQYLSGARAVAHAGGSSYCRFGCGLTGCAERSDGVWLWPEGLAHYVQHHAVRLPEEFVSHIRNRGYCPSPAEEAPMDFLCQSSSFWRSWCASQKPQRAEPI
jgi:hypothetical protein